MIYLLPLLILLFVAIYREYINDYSVKSNRPIFFIFLSYLVVLMAFRYRIGIDTLTYMDKYQYVESIGNTTLSAIFSEYEPLNGLLRSITKSFSDDFLLFQIVHVVLLNTLLARFILRHTDKILLGLFFYFLLAGIYFNTEILRESLAVAVFLNAYDFLLKKKWIQYYLCAFIALGFHTSALITFIIPFIRHFKANKFFILVLIGFAISLMVFAPQLQLIALYLSPEAASKVLFYLDTFNFDFNFNRYLVGLSRDIILPFILLHLYKKKVGENKYEGIICLSILFSVGSMLFPVLFGRLTNYFLFYYIILLAEASKLNKAAFQHKFVYLAGICGVFMVTMFMDYMRKNEDNKNDKLIRYYPYSSVITKEKYPPRESLWFSLP